MDLQDILNKLRISQLNEMQQHAAEAITGSDGDVVLLSPTGTGKTLAYLLPLVQLIKGQSSMFNDQCSMVNDQWPIALVITPGRELALQSHQVLKSMACGVRSTACYGGRAAMDEHRVLREVRPQIVFGTPGRLNDHLGKDNISRYSIRYLVIDEFDKCLAMGFHAEMQRLIKSLPGLQRRILLSATNAEQIPQFVNLSKKGTLIDFLPESTVNGQRSMFNGQCSMFNGQSSMFNGQRSMFNGQRSMFNDQCSMFNGQCSMVNDQCSMFNGQCSMVNDRVTLYEVRSPQKDKLNTLRQLLMQLGDESSIVFLNYRDSVERVNNYLVGQGFVTSHFHGGMEQRQREDMLYKFSNGSANILVATDLASRGLDIPDIQNIIHYHLPESEEGYIHRVGRTARWDATGRAFFILNSEEHIPDYVIEHSPLNIEHYDLANNGESSISNAQSSMFNVQSSMFNAQSSMFNVALSGESAHARHSSNEFGSALAQSQTSMFNVQSSMSNGQIPPQPRMATLYIGKGKKDKISKGDIVGFLCKTGGLQSSDIGRIDVKDRYAYVAIRREKLKQTLHLVQGQKIKGLKTIIEPIH